MRRIALVIAIAPFAILACSEGSVPAAVSPACPPVRIASQVALAHAIANGKERIQVLVASRTGANARVTEKVRTLGGRVLVRVDSVDYLRVELPVESYVPLCRNTDVAALIPNGAKRPQPYRDDLSTRRKDPMDVFGEEVAKRPMKPVRREEPRSLTPDMLAEGNPYLPIHHVGALALRKLEPRADGRGVTIANMEGLFDPSHPTMRGALDLDGKPIGKIAGVIDPAATEDMFASDTARVSGAPGEDETLVRADTTIEVGEGGRTTVLGRPFKLPAAGSYSAGRYRPGKEERAVFWTANRQVWIDTNDDADLTDERALSEIASSTDSAPAFTTLRRSARKSGETKRSSFPTLLVQFDTAGRPHVYAPTSGHSIMVSSTAAGSNFLGGEGRSVAPAARLMLVNGNNDDYFGASLGQYLEAYILAARDPRVDVLTVSDTYEITPNGAGESVPGIIMERLATVYGKLMLMAADNQGMLGHPTVQSYSPLVLSIGAYIGGETIRALYGWDLAPDNLAIYSSGGPSIDGAMKPDFVAPTMSLAADACDATDRNLSLFRLPQCYMIGGGTSNATPFAAGSAAALISAAKLHRLPTDAKHIAWALRTGARSLEGYGIAEAGAGLVQLDRSFELLQRKIEIPDVRASAPVERMDALYLDTPGQGHGLMLSDGWWPGRSEQRRVTISIPETQKARNYALRWRGNDGTFSFADGEVRAASGKRTDVNVLVAPKTPGMHAAVIEVVDPETDVPVAQVAAAVVAAARPDSTNGFSVEQAIGNSWPREGVSFVDVPQGASVLRLEVTGQEGKICHATMLPSSTTIDGSDVGTWHFWQTLVRGESRATSMMNPLPGAWQYRATPCSESFTYNRMPDSAQYHVKLSASTRWTIYAGSMAPGTVENAESGGARITATFTNNGATIQEPRVVATAGSVVAEVSGTLADTAVQYEVTVDSAASNLYVTLDVEGGTETPLVDLYLYRCNDGRCRLAQMRPGLLRHKVIRVPDPLPGTWKALVIPVGDAARGARHSSVAVVTSDRYGRVTATLEGSGPLPSRGTRGATLQLSSAPKVDSGRVVLIDLVDDSMKDVAPKHYVRVQTGAFLDWPPVPVASGIIRIR